MKLSVDDFPGNCAGKYAFGVGPQQTAATLRKVADAIEAMTVLLQGAEVKGVADADEFTVTCLKLRFAQTVCKTDP